RGIRRYGDATVPLDDALARVVVDVSGRPYLAYHADPPTWQKLGDYDVALTPEFFRALATHGGLTLHVDLLRGQNAHHVVEAVFKAARSEEHTSELQSLRHLVCRLLLEKKK